MEKFCRRKILKLTALSGLVTLLGKNGFAQLLSLTPTPGETQGPFYPLHEQRDKDDDLTHFDGHTTSALGPHILVRGQVLDTAGNRIAGALLDIWQADVNGRYRHRSDRNPARLDPNFQGWAMMSSDHNGYFEFKTVMPGAYPADKDWIRPPHIHFKISKQGYRALTTQMYFPDEALNGADLLLRSKSIAERTAMIAKKLESEGKLPIYGYNVVLELLRN